MEKSYTIIISVLLFLFVFGYVFFTTNATDSQAKTFSTLKDFENSQEIKKCSFATNGCNNYRIIDWKIGPSTQNICEQNADYYCVEYTQDFIW